MYIRFFDEIDLKQVASVGGKNASLGEMVQNLRTRGIPVPDGFAITAAGYWRFIEANGLQRVIRRILRGLDMGNVADLAERGRAIRQAILSAEIPSGLAAAMEQAYLILCKSAKREDVAVRSSATAEDLPTASFAGQQETYLNVRGVPALLEAVRKCYASLFTDRAIAYREEKGFDHLKVALSVGIQQMVRSDLAAAGVMFTLDTDTGFNNVVLINASYGLGESVVKGLVNPDQYYVFKPRLTGKFDPVISRRVGDKSFKIIYGKHGTRKMILSAKERQKFCLRDEEVKQLARWGVAIEKYYTQLAGKWQPMDIEWAKDGRDGKLYVVQARPETVYSQKDVNVLEEYKLTKKGRLIAQGLAIGSKIGQGAARVIRDLKNISTFREGEVLVTRQTDPDWVPVMRRASAIITEEGGRTCHAAIVARELGKPAVVGVAHATELIQSGRPVTVSCAEGEAGRIYAGTQPYVIQRTQLKTIPKTRTAVMLNLANPEQAFEQSFLPNRGVGLVRTEFIFTENIKIHPLALLNFNKLQDKELKRKIEELTAGYKNKKQFLVDRLAEGLAKLAAAFYPHDVIARFSDFKTNEYAGLIGGELYEPKEANPMMGWRGASRYYDPAYKEAFKLECAAFKKVRDVMGLTNLVAMVPFCRTPEEGRLVLDTMKEAGLERGANGLRVFVMVEVPSNVILAAQFADLFDGFSIGSNDLTQLTLGVDRDSALVSKLYDESNPAVLASIKHVIQVAKEKKIKVGLCGQAPSDSPEFAQFLVKEKIDSISLNPDSVIKTLPLIAAAEKRRGK